MVNSASRCEYKGEVPVKHKGQIKMYLVLGLLPELQREGHPNIPTQNLKSAMRISNKG